MDSPQLMGDPHYQVCPYYEIIRDESSSPNSTPATFLIHVLAKFTRSPLSDDDEDETLIYNDTEESVVFSHTLPLPLEKLLDANEARAAIGALLADLHVPSSLPFITDEIVSCGRTMWNELDHGLRYRVLCVRVDIDVYVDELPASEPSDDEYGTSGEDDRTVVIGFVAASRESVEGLEKVRIDDDRAVQVSCAVCLEGVLVGSEATKLPCSHLFHGDCIVRWLQNSKFCPLCRFEMPS
ncbi:43kDa postsynaptic protein [Trema orientale]|uniref:RING-type E3 ubiquitin transferase n=1 Tax=Trema orientale TaxID=63057 RepID=A0A2P5F7A6_TREOI|nr:43kDa postsynaptic protein [Trema orientale]